MSAFTIMLLSLQQHNIWYLKSSFISIPTFHLQREYIETQYLQQTLEFYRRAYTYVHNQSLAHKCFEPFMAYNWQHLFS